MNRTQGQRRRASPSIPSLSYTQPLLTESDAPADGRGLRFQCSGWQLNWLCATRQGSGEASVSGTEHSVEDSKGSMIHSIVRGLCHETNKQIIVPATWYRDQPRDLQGIPYLKSPPLHVDGAGYTNAAPDTPSIDPPSQDTRRQAGNTDPAHSCKWSGQASVFNAQVPSARQPPSPAPKFSVLPQFGLNPSAVKPPRLRGPGLLLDRFCKREKEKNRNDCTALRPAHGLHISAVLFLRVKRHLVPSSTMSGGCFFGNLQAVPQQSR